MSLHAIGVQMLAGPAPAAGTAGAAPAVALEVSLNTDPGATPVWLNISEWLEDHTVNRGRGQESEKFRAGTAEIILANEDRRFDPTHAGGPHYPNLLPMRRVRLRSTYEAVTYDVFTGYADGWEQQYRHPGVAFCRLTATDAFKVFNQIELPSSAYAAEVRADAPTLWYRLDEPSGSTTLFDSSGDDDLTVSTSPPAFGVAGLVTKEPGTAIEVTNTAQGAGRYGPPSVTGPPFTFEMIYKSPGSPSGTSLYGETSGETPLYGWAVQASGGVASMIVITSAGQGTVQLTSSLDDGDPHHIAFSWAADGALSGWFDGVLQGVSYAPPGTFPTIVYAILGAGQTPAAGGVALHGTYDEVAVYPAALTTTRVLAHATARAAPWNGDTSGARINRLLDAGGWPAADREIDTGTSILQSAALGGTLLAALQKVEETEQGRLFITKSGKVRFIGREGLMREPYVTAEAVFGDTDPELEYGDLKYRYDDGTIANEVTVSRNDGKAQTVSDVASQSKYLRRSRVLDGLLHNSDATSLDMANWILNHYKEPFLRATQMRLEPDAGNATTHYPQVLGRELADRVTVRRRPQSVGSAIDQDAWVEAITHRSRALEWKTDWNLSPADPSSEAALWDSGLWDTAEWSF